MVVGEEHEPCGAEGTREIADPDEGPGAENLPGRQPPARPSHHHQHVAGEDLRAAQQDEAEPETEDKAGDHGGANRVERLINRLKQFRRIATRYEKSAANYLAIVTFGMILLWL